MIFSSKQIFRYFVMPEIIPHLKALFGSGFGHVALFIAHIFRTVKLLPDHHPYLSAINTGRFGIRHVVAAAANNLEFKKDNIDQIIMFFAILLGIVILFVQFFTLLFGLFFMSAANASTGVPLNFFDFFTAQQPTDHDVALAMLEMVFGVPGIGGPAGFFDTCVSQAIPCFETGGNRIVGGLPGDNLTPTDAFSDYNRNNAVGPLSFPSPFHLALQSMLQLYSVGLLVIAVIIFLYFIIAIVAETAQEGIPFGRRFNKVWAPLRMVVALGLLIPIANGLNAGQYLVLYAAKFGSNFATNGWIIFNDIAVSGTVTLLGETDTLVATPKGKPINTIVEFSTILATCILAEKYVNSRQIRAYHVKPTPAGGGVQRIPAFGGTTFAQALTFFENRDILIVFGEYTTRGASLNPAYGAFQGYVTPFCGEIILPVPTVNQTQSPGAYEVTRRYYEEFLAGIYDEATGFGAFAFDPTTNIPNRLDIIGSNIVLNNIPSSKEDTNIDPPVPPPDMGILSVIVDDYQSSGTPNIDQILRDGVATTIANADWNNNLIALGWGGGGIWYNRLAQLNGALVAASYKLPIVKNYPMLMEYIRKQRQTHSAALSGYDRFKPYQPDEVDIEPLQPGDVPMAKALYQSHKIWEDVYEGPESGNAIIDTIISVMGLEGLFNMVDNPTIHPLAQLVAVGKSLLESSIQAIAVSFGVGVVGGLAGNNAIGIIANTVSSFSSSIGMIGLGIGFVLFYIIPFLPFLYFFFAVGGWVKGIFEAMVGVPLWALAHIRIDGNGLPGDAAMGGYYLIFEIFLRPILIVFGMVAGISIFAAQARILNEIWPLVTTNLSGFDDASAVKAKAGETGSIEFMRSHVDRLFFTVVYAIIVYLLATASFKLVTLLPNYLLRWMGANVQTFGEQSGDPAENLVRNTMIGSQLVTSNLGGSLNRLKASFSAGQKR